MPFPQKFFFFTLFLFIPLIAVGIEQPKFDVLKTEGDFQLRQMESFAVAETEVRGSFEEAGNMAFRKLFKYIQGDNQGSKNIPMTAPVGQEEKAGEKIAMTAPVSQSPSEPGFRVSFALPSIYNAKTAPKPNDSSITVRQVSARKVAVITYSGRWSESRYEQKKEALLQWMRSEGLTSKKEPIFARYNSPFTLWFLRHNEIQIEVE